MLQHFEKPYINIMNNNINRARSFLEICHDRCDAKFPVWRYKNNRLKPINTHIQTAAVLETDDMYYLRTLKLVKTTGELSLLNISLLRT